jgi:hypothetical protein
MASAAQLASFRRAAAYNPLAIAGVVLVFIFAVLFSRLGSRPRILPIWVWPFG